MNRSVQEVLECECRLDAGAQCSDDKERIASGDAGNLVHEIKIADVAGRDAVDTMSTGPAIDPGMPE